MRRLAKLQADSELPLWWNRSYPVNIALPLFTGTTAGGGYPAASGVLNIDTGITFFALGLEASYTVNGLLTEDDSPASLTMPESMRPRIFDATWTIRDSGTDRDWSNLAVPLSVIRTGNMGNFAVGAQARLAGGTKVTITVNPTYFDSTSTATGLKTFSSHSLQFVITGVAVKDGVL